MSDTYTNLNDASTEVMSTLAEPKVTLRDYVLPPATDTTLGGIIVGDGLSVDVNGKVSATGQRKTATTEEITLYLEVNNNIAMLFDYDEVMPAELIGKEIAKIEYLENGIWKDFEELNVTYVLTPTIRTNKRICTVDTITAYAIFSPLLASPSWFAENSFIEATRVTYYI